MSSKKKVVSVLTGKNSMEYTLLTILRKNYIKEDTLILMDSDPKGLDMLEDTRPFFSEKYLLIYYTNKVKADKVKKLVKKVESLEYWDIILMSEKKMIKDIIEEELKDYKTVNLNNPPEWLIAEHVKIHVKYKFTIAGYESFINRMKYQWRYLDDYVVQLNDVVFEQKESDEGEGRAVPELLTPKIVNKIIPKYNDLNFNQILEDMLLGKSMRKHIKKLEGYKYAHKYTYKMLMDKIELLISIKSDYCIGNLTLSTMVDYCNSNNIMYFECKNMVNNTMHIVTLEKLYKIRHKMLQYKGKTNPLIEFFLDTGLV